MPSRFIDLFCGMGGFRLGLEACGAKCVFSCEIDKFACQMYRNHFGDDPSGDVRALEMHDIPEHDILCAGFPCQSFSHAGRRDVNDERGNLFQEIIRIADYHRPDVLLLENVPALAQGKMKPHFERICQAINDIGYQVNVSLLNAADYGVPQARKRLYFVCLRSDLGWYYVEPQPTYEPCALADVLEPEPVAERYYLSEKAIAGFAQRKANNKANGKGFGWQVKSSKDGVQCLIKDDRIVQTGSLKRIARLDDGTKHGGQGYKVYDKAGACVSLSGGSGGRACLIKVGDIDGRRDRQQNRVFDSAGVACTQAANGGGWGAKTGLYKVGHLATSKTGKIKNRVYPTDGPASTQMATPGGRANQTGLYARGDRIRRLTPREAMRVMVMPENYEIVVSDTQAYRCAGNAVIPKMISLVYNGIRK